MAKKPVFLDDVEWGNIELEGFSDEQLFDPNLNHRLAMKVRSEDPKWLKKTAEAGKRRAQDPEWQKKNAESNRRKAQDPKWQKNHAEAIAQRTQDPEWRKKNAESNRRKAQDPKWQKNNAQANKLKAQDPEYRAALKAKIRLHQGRAIVTPEGQFDSRAEAVDYYWDNKILPTRKTRRSLVRYFENQLKKEGSGFYYV